MVIGVFLVVSSIIIICLYAAKLSIHMKTNKRRQYENLKPS